MVSYGQFIFYFGMSTDVLDDSNIDDAKTFLIIVIPATVSKLQKIFKKCIVETSRKAKTIAAFSIAHLHNRKAMECIIRMYYYC